MKECKVECRGEVSYPDSLQLQKQAVKQRQKGEIPDTLLFVEHPHVYTIGKVGTDQNLLVDEKKLREVRAEVFRSDRGGGITYHGPGQIIGYPILDLNELKRDVKWYVEQLEEVMIQTVAAYGLQSGRIKGLTGAWIDDRKIGAIGVRVAQWITSHGFALNVTTDLTYFRLIVPCGISGKQVTSLSAELGREIAVEDVRSHIIQSFGKVFDRTMTYEENLPEKTQAP